MLNFILKTLNAISFHSKSKGLALLTYALKFRVWQYYIIWLLVINEISSYIGEEDLRFVIKCTNAVLNLWSYIGEAKVQAKSFLT